MTFTSLPPDRFEERLLRELKRVVAMQPSPATAVPESRPVLSRTRYRLVLAGTGVAAAAATAVLVSGGDPTTPAYAVQARADGTVTVEIHSLRDADGLERKLRAAGVPAVVDYLPEGKVCAPGRYRTPSRTGSGTVSHGSQGIREDGSATFTLDRDMLRSGETLVIESSVGAVTSVGVGFAEGPVGPCVPVDAPSGGPGGSGGSGAGPGGTRSSDGGAYGTSRSPRTEPGPATGSGPAGASSKRAGQG